MGWYKDIPLQAIYRNFPKVDLHRHLEGSLRLETLTEVAKMHGITLPLAPDLGVLVQVQEDDPLTYRNFLQKFQTLRHFYRSPTTITRMTREAIVDAAEDDVRYLELIFTPAAISRVQGFALSDVIDWVTMEAMETSQEYGILTRLIVSVNRHESAKLAEQVIQLAVDRKARGIVGIDLAGNEADFSPEPFISMFAEAKREGLSITIHAGEWGGAANVRLAIERLGADRIGHGVRLLEDAEVTAMAIERQIPFEVCVTSNIQSGVFPRLHDHPLVRMYVSGINVTINTDDPGISRITLSDEYRVAVEELGLPISVLAGRVLASARASFLPEVERQHLEERLRQELSGLVADDFSQ